MGDTYGPWFVRGTRLAFAEGANLPALCRRFAVSRRTGHKWLARHRAGGGVADRPNALRQIDVKGHFGLAERINMDDGSRWDAPRHPSRNLSPMSPNTCDPCFRSRPSRRERGQTGTSILYA